jgi:hypothetical protein
MRKKISDAPRTHGWRGAQATTRDADATGNLGAAKNV